MKKILAIIFGLIVVSAIYGGCTSEDADTTGKKVASEGTEQQTTSESGSDSENTVEKFKIGDTIEVEDGMTIKLNKVRKSQGKDFFKPQKDMYLVASVTIENKSDKPIVVSSLANFELADSEGVRYNIALNLDKEGQVDGTIAPGQKLKGDLSYDVNKADSYDLMYKEMLSTKQTIWTFTSDEIESD
jgi:hypothetical protein